MIVKFQETKSLPIRSEKGRKLVSSQAVDNIVKQVDGQYMVVKEVNVSMAQFMENTNVRCMAHTWF